MWTIYSEKAVVVRAHYQVLGLDVCFRKTQNQNSVKTSGQSKDLFNLVISFFFFFFADYYNQLYTLHQHKNHIQKTNGLEDCRFTNLTFFPSFPAIKSRMGKNHLLFSFGFLAGLKKHRMILIYLLQLSTTHKSFQCPGICSTPLLQSPFLKV